jgi:hypothetical protein
VVCELAAVERAGAIAMGLKVYGKVMSHVPLYISFVILHTKQTWNENDFTAHG